LENVAVDLGYGFVKAISSSGKRVIFPSLVGKGYDRGITNILGDTPNDMANMHVTIENEDYFVGELANESRSLSRIFERERFNHIYTHILLNTAIQLVAGGRGGSVNLSTGLPLDFYQAQAKDFQSSITGIQSFIEWKSGPLVEGAKQVNVERALVFPQGASAIFSALINHEGKFTYPQFMNQGSLIGLIDIGFRTTDFVVVEIQENGSFVPKAKLSGTVDDGVNNLYRDIRQSFKTQTGGADLSELYINRILKDEQLKYKGNSIDFSQIIQSSKKSIATNIVDRLKNVWAEESDLFDAIFLAGGGGELFEPFIQPHFDNRLLKITESQFANTIGYLRLGKSVFEQLERRHKSVM
jgi:plasmid segregation protein ParM